MIASTRPGLSYVCYRGFTRQVDRLIYQILQIPMKIVQLLQAALDAARRQVYCNWYLGDSPMIRCCVCDDPIFIGDRVIEVRSLVLARSTLTGEPFFAPSPMEDGAALKYAHT